MKTMIFRSLLIVAGIGTIFGFVGWNHPQSPGKEAGPLSPFKVKGSVASKNPVLISQDKLGEIASAVTDSSDLEKVQGPRAVPLKHEVLEAYAYRDQIESFRSLSKKVFLSDEERRTKRELLESKDFLKSLAGLLKVGAGQSTEMKQTQDAALDVLFESLRADQASPGVEVLAEVVSDGQIENEATDMVTKRDLAGVKAEVLYYWSSLDPASAGRIEQALPGPISRRIWENVISVQKNNLAESTLEAASYPAFADAL
ncbi:MAG: hypothetical protein ACK5P7_11180 [Bdellovibrio sp.]